MRNGTGRAGRTRGALLACLALLAAAACSDSTGPSPVADLNIGGAPAAPLRVGDTLTLSITLVNAAGSPVTGRAVSWRSSAPAVASVTQEGRVAALSPGQAWIAASAGGVSDSVSVTVASISTSQACLQSSAALTLAVGEVRQVVMDAAGIACIQGPQGG
ncbi:MAG TPA: Ig-like domain-containing protein, partial [Longimicrobiaceae bacterium]